MADAGASRSLGQSESITDAEYDPSKDTFGASELSVELQALREVLTEGIGGAQASEHRGELTVEVAPETLLDALTFCKTDERVACDLLSDLSWVHWPGGVIEENSQETTGWPTFTETVEQGRIQVDYILRSIAHNHWFRLRVNVPDTDSELPTATGHYGSANFMEREAFDMIGITFTGHPNMNRVLMPEDWEGHPHRKDYPLGGVEVMYKGKTVPPPDERYY